MPGEPAQVDPIVVNAWLDDAELDLDAARRLASDPPNRHASFHLQQAAEKLIKAVRLARGQHATAEHALEKLIAALPEADEWRAKLTPLGPLSAYSTTYRYPSPVGRTKHGLAAAETTAWVSRIAKLISEARSLAQ
jgi:HEPN domain-containing protein